MRKMTARGTRANEHVEETRVFHMLDGLRGIAAICVALHHLARWPIGLRDPVPQAALAVDLFFVLSGFVLAHAYQGKLDAGVTSGEFMRLRVVRLWPLYILGTCIKLCAILVMISQGEAWSLAGAGWSFGFALFFLPTPLVLSASGVLYPLNGPAWSLFFELAVNYVWVALARRSRVVVLATVCLASMLGLLAFGFSEDTFPGGLPRVGFSFFAGILAYAAWKRWPSPWRVGTWVGPIALVAVVAVFAAPVSDSMRAAYELCAVALFPAFIWASAKIAIDGVPRATMSLLGAASYGVYALHDPLFFAMMNFGWLGPLRGLPAPLVSALILVMLFGLTLGVDRAFDRPARRWLLARLSRRASRAMETALAR
jgi:peptidoglycan/LPS O-acetylase OafA/YrhL